MCIYCNTLCVYMEVRHLTGSHVCRTADSSILICRIFEQLTDKGNVLLCAICALTYIRPVDKHGYTIYIWWDEENHISALYSTT